MCVSVSKCSAVMLFRKRSRVLRKDCDSSPVKGGRPEAYHETITAAFLALIGERRLD